MATGVRVSRSGNQLIDGQLGGWRWDGVLTYADPARPADYGSDYDADEDRDGVSARDEGFARLSADQLATVHAALSADENTTAALAGFSVEGMTGLETAYVAGSGAADVRLANSTDAETAYAYYPGKDAVDGDVWFGPSGVNPVPGTYDAHTILHELGHALGLKHGHEIDKYGALPAPYDSMEYSVMTYRSFTHGPEWYSNEHFGFAQTYMIADIAALQHLYGADFTTSAGNTVYAWTPESGATRVNGAVAFEPGDNRIFLTIWDGGGTDTYDLSAYKLGVRVDLTPGAYSLLSDEQTAELDDYEYAHGNVYNALQYQGDPRSLIENAIGGEGGDYLYGNAADNDLRGGAGWDDLYGRDGDDALHGGADYDILDGGDGDDLIVGGRAGDDLTGNRGRDVFAYGSRLDSRPSDWDQLNPGECAAFEKPGEGKGDLFDLTTFDADVTTPGRQSFAFGTEQGTGCLWAINAGNRKTLIRGNIDGDDTVEFQVAIDDGSRVRAGAYSEVDFLV